MTDPTLPSGHVPPHEPEGRARWNAQFDVMTGPIVVSYLLEQIDDLRAGRQELLEACARQERGRHPNGHRLTTRAIRAYLGEDPDA